MTVVDYQKTARTDLGRRRTLIFLAAGAACVCGLAAGIVYVGLRSADFERRLPSGYQLVRSNADDTCILDTNSEELAVPANIDRLALVPEAGLIVGHARGSPVGPTSGGYFLIDTKTRTATVGLSEAAWRAQVAARVRGPIPTLIDPRDIRERNAW